MPNQLNMSYINLTGTNPGASRLSFRQRVEIKTLRRHTSMSYTEIREALNLPRSTVSTVCNEPKTPEKRTKHPEIRLVDTPAKERLIAFVESSADARRMIWSELIQHQGLNCSSRTLQRYLHDAGFRRCLAVPKP